MSFNKQKGPLIITAALLAGLPICSAQAAFALSGVYGTEQTSRLQSQTQPQKVLPTQGYSFLGQKLQTKLSSGLPNSTDIDTLQSTLDSYKSQLATLKAKTPKDPAVKASLQTAISSLEADIASLEAAINQLKSTFTLLTKHTTTLAQATLTYNQAIAAKTDAAKKLSDAESYELQTLNTKLEKQNNLDTLNNLLTSATQAKESAAQEVTSAAAALDAATIKFTEAKAARDAAKQTADQASSLLSTKSDELGTAQASYDAAKAATDATISDYNNLINVYNSVYSDYQKAEAAYTSAQQTLNQAQAQLNTAQSNYDNNLIPDPTWTAPTQQVAHTRQVAHTETVQVVTPTPHTETIQHVTQVPVYTQVATTTLVPTTTTTTQQSENILPELSHTVWTGAGTGFQGSYPTINQGVVKFSYINQTVSYTANTQVAQGTPLVLSVDVKNQDANRNQQDTYKIELITYNANGQQNGYAVYNSPTGWHDWTIRTVTVTPTSDVASYQVKLTGFDGGYWYGTYGPEMRTPTLSTTTTTTTTTYEEVTTYETVTTYVDEITYEDITVWEDVVTYEEVTTYTEETYYTTEVVLTQGTVNVQINEGGQATFTAPEGAVFTGSNLRYEAKDRPQCGANISPNVQGKTQVTIAASNGAWGDPCGGWYKHVVGTLTYLGQPTAPLIKNSALLPALQQAQADYDAALEAYNLASTNWTKAQQDQQKAAADTNTGYNLVISKSEVQNAAYSSLQQAQSSYDLALGAKTTADSALTNADSALSSATSEQDSASSILASKQSTLGNANALLTKTTTDKVQAQTELTTAETTYNQAVADKATASSNFLSADQTLLASTTSKQLAEQDVAQAEQLLTNDSQAVNKASGLVSFTAAEQLLNKEPEPQPEPEPQGSPEIPKDLSADNLMEVDLKAVDPTELTPEQATQLVEAALETFNTATEGSPEYEQALDALYLAAQQDDIVVDESIASIPGVGQAAEAVVAVLNIVGNVGADISPKARKKAQTLVVTTLVVGQIAQTAALATASAGGYRRRN